MLWNKCMQFYFHLPIFVRLLLTVIITMLLFGFSIHLIEPAHFPSLFDGVWWAFVTGSTVGYGDYVPLSTTGKLIGMLLILAGGGLVTFYMATISAATITHEKNLTEGKISYHGQEHVIIVGWNERTKRLVDMIQHNQIKKEIVLIDQSLKKVSYQKHRIHFIHGDPTSDHILKKANIACATHIIITADPSLEEEDADRQTILNIIAAKGNHPSVHIIAEILTETHETNAIRAGCDNIIRANQFMSALFLQTLYHSSSQTNSIITKLLTEQQFCTIPLKKEWINQDFNKLVNDFSTQKYWLVGYIRSDELYIYPDSFTKMEGHDQLIYLKNSRTNKDIT